uniref:Uncharacterized protein n=1 Tax=Anguilla anguilla TaxID=7936 RepID=A0A0E9RPX5_ANGAN
MGTQTINTLQSKQTVQHGLGSVVLTDFVCLTVVLVISV